jgi:hypothetical protein
MSYCRWSTDNFNCDFYCYESDEGFVTHIAAKRRRIWLRVLLRGIKQNRDWFTRIEDKLPKTLMLNHIKHEWAGKSFVDETEAEMFARIRLGVKTGLHCPKSVYEEQT